MNRISVVIPLYNKRPYVRRCLDSVLRQTILPAEVIVVDDGSTDGSRELVESQADPLIRLLVKENGGVSSARNLGIHAAKGELIAFLDADDAWKPDFLQTISTLGVRFPQAAVLTTGHRRIYRGGYSDISVASPDGSREFLVGNVFRALLDYSFITSSNTAVRRDVFDKVGLFREGENFGEDQEMWARLAFCYEVAHSKKILAEYFCNLEAKGPARSKHNLRPPPLVSTLREFLHSVERTEERGQTFIKLANKKIFERFEGATLLHSKQECCQFLRKNLLHVNKLKLTLLMTLLRIVPGRIIYLWSKVRKSRQVSSLLNTFSVKRIDITYVKRKGTEPNEG